MTTGNITDPDWGNVDAYGNRYGYRFKRYWSGADNVAGQPQTEHNYLLVWRDSWTAPLVKRTYIGGGATQLMGATAFAEPTFPAYSNLQARSLGKLYGKLKGHDFNAGIFAAEMKKSLAMVAQRARRIAQAYRMARRGNYSGASMVLTGASPRTPDGRVASNWLELQYGWYPLLNDVYNSVGFVHSRMSAPPLPQQRGSAQEVQKPGSGPTFHSFKKAERTVRCQHLCKPVVVMNLAASSGLTDPASVAWEVLLYSFVADWFIPIGPWLEAVSAAREIQGAILQTFSTLTEVSGLKSGSFYKVEGGESYSHRLATVNRTLHLNSIPLHLPVFKPIMASSSLHVANGIALLVNATRPH